MPFGLLFVCLPPVVVPFVCLHCVIGLVVFGVRLVAFTQYIVAVVWPASLQEIWFSRSVCRIFGVWASILAGFFIAVCVAVGVFTFRIGIDRGSPKG